MRRFVFALFLSLSLTAPVAAQETLSAPPPGGDRLGIPSLPQHVDSEGQIAADSANPPAQTNTPTNELTYNPSTPGEGLTTLAPQDGPRSVTDIDPSELPKELLDEMTSVEAECSSNHYYAAFHDCRCIAVKFLDERIKRGPYAVRNIIMNDVNNQCPNIPGVAGHMYRSCKEYMSWAREDHEKFCTCAANKVAEQYGRNPRMNTRYIQGLRKSAMVECGMPRYGSTNDPDIQF